MLLGYVLAGAALTGCAVRDEVEVGPPEVIVCPPELPKPMHRGKEIECPHTEDLWSESGYWAMLAYTGCYVGYNAVVAAYESCVQEMNEVKQ